MEKAIITIICVLIIIGSILPAFLPCIDTSDLENDSYFTVFVPMVVAIAVTVIIRIFLPLA